MNKVIAHLSDLHFGHIEVATLDPLVRALEDLRPDLIAVSGSHAARAPPRIFGSPPVSRSPARPADRGAGQSRYSGA